MTRGSDPGPVRAMRITSAADLPVPALSEQVASYICCYTPRVDPHHVWPAMADQVRALVVATEPVSREDAKAVLAAVFQLASWAQVGYAHLSLFELFDTDVLNRFLVGRRGQDTQGTCNLKGERLDRCRRVLDGEAPRTRRAAAEPGEPPYNDADLAALVRAASSDPGLLQALAAALGDGTVAPELHTLPALALTDVRDVFERWALPLPDMSPAPVRDPAAWAAVRARAAERAGVHLTPRRLRLTFLARLVATPGVPAAALVVHHELTRRGVDEALKHHPVWPAHVPGGSR